MTRINTNVSSLVARNTLGRSNADLEQALTRLSTGLRINTGKDDPAGLIASENLRSDITSVKRAISNTDRANQVIATADSALGQVSSLLNDIRGLVTESANAGVQSPAQLAANQAQVDSSLDALNRIAQTTTFQGRKLLDGSLDFVTQAGANFSKLQTLQIDQANLGATGSVPVAVNVSAAATKAQVNVANVPSGSGTGVAASTTVSFNSQATPGTAASGSIGFTVGTGTSSGTVAIDLAIQQASGTVTLGGETFDLAADASGALDGAAGNAVTQVDITYGNGAASAAYSSGTLTVNLTQASGVATIQNVIDTINGQVGSDFTAALGGATGSTTITAASSTAASLTGGRDASTESIAVTGAAAGTSGNITIELVTGGTAGTVTSVSGGYQIDIGSSDISVSAIAGYINGLSEVNATYGGSGTFLAAADSVPATDTISGGSQTTQSLDIASLATSAGSNLALTFVQGGSAGVSGSAGTYTITYTAGSTLNDVLSQIETIAEVDTVETKLATGATGTNTIISAPAGVNSILGYTAPVNGDDVITIESDTVGTGGNGKTVTINETSTSSLFDATTGVGVVADTNGNITVSLNSAKTDISIADIANAIDSLTGYSATVSSAAGSGAYDSTAQTPPTVANTAGGAAAGGLAAAAVLELAGLNGSEVLSFGAGTSITDLVNGINLVKDATGVEATAAGTTLQLKSSEYGSEAVVDLKVISEGSGSTIFSSVATKRDTGTDIQATVNGVVANGKGNSLEINTATLDLKASIEAGFEGLSAFTITGGGALFQLGPDVVSNQQARLGISSVNTARLGGVSGKLYELANGNAASLANDPNAAASIVEEAIDQITSLRGRLGAFQRTTLETNKNALSDTLTNLSEAESAIR
ncbi:MAG: flagellin, partial [Planctomycetales bacterium]|nr:flagellin [Planctomycetales bacterium]